MGLGRLATLLGTVLLVSPARADLSTLYGALAYADISHDLQHLARLISAEHTRSLSCFAANRIAQIFQAAEALAALGAQQFKTAPMNTQQDWDRLLLGLIEVLRIDSSHSCKDIHVDPRLCEEISEIGELFLRKRVCADVSDVDWRRTRCPAEASADTRQQRPAFRLRTPSDVHEDVPHLNRKIIYSDYDAPMRSSLSNLDSFSQQQIPTSPRYDIPSMKEFDMSFINNL